MDNVEVVRAPPGQVMLFYISRAVDVMLALPTLLLVLAIIGTLGTSVPLLLFAIVVSTWQQYARVMRGLVLSMREREFILSARAVGASHLRIMLRHVLPNTISPVVVLASLQIGTLVLLLAALGFLGFGVQPPAPEWGTMLNKARVHFRANPRARRASRRRGASRQPAASDICPRIGRRRADGKRLS